jgi:ribonuclease HII
MTSDRERFMLRHERKIWKRGIPYIAGLDEAGRGPLAGPVVAAAVVASPGFFLPEVNDSKQLTAAVRERLFEDILKGAYAVGIGIVDHDAIDRINILNATFLAMHRAIAQLPEQPGHLLVDGNRFRQHLEHVPSSVQIPFTLLVGGDARCFSIAAASIIAKVTRDRLMVEYDRQFPGYEFARHKGYPTPQHRAAITRLGLSPIHRRSFAHPTQCELDLSGL